MKRLVQRAIKKRKPGRNSEQNPGRNSQPSSQRNLTEPPGEYLLTDLQYPSTILHHMKSAQREKFTGFLSGIRDREIDEETMGDLLDRQPTLHRFTSRNGCGKWVYNSRFMSDGQDRFETTDDISFDVLGSFCPSCELSRRLMELKPVHYEVPEEGETLVPSSEGFTDRNWSIGYDPVVDRCSADKSVNGKCFWDLSPDRFRGLLAMVTNVKDYKEIACIVGGYVCGNRRVYVSEIFKGVGYEDREMDFQTDVVDVLYGMEEPRYFSDVSIQITVNEFNPIVEESEGDQVFYSPSMILNPLSRIIYNMSVRLQIGTREHIFHCSETPTPNISFQVLRSLTEFPEWGDAYPKFYTGVRGYGPIFAYAVFYMNDPPDGNFSRIVHEDPRQFYKIVGLRIGNEREDAIRVFRERIIELKKKITMHTLDDTIKIIRMCLGGLEIKK